MNGSRQLPRQIFNVIVRGYGSHGKGSAPHRGSSGIEHADSMAALGAKHKVDPKLYESKKYYEHNTWTYYDLEVELTKHRLPQPNPKVADTPRQSSGDAKK